MPVKCIMQYGDIAEASDPLGIMLQPMQVDMVQEPHGAIAPPGTPDRAHFRVINNALKVLRTLKIGPCLLELFATDAFSQPHLQSPAFCQGNTFFQLFNRNGARRGYDGDGIALA